MTWKKPSLTPDGIILLLTERDPQLLQSLSVPFKLPVKIPNDNKYRDPELQLRYIFFPERTGGRERARCVSSILF